MAGIVILVHSPCSPELALECPNTGVVYFEGAAFTVIYCEISVSYRRRRRIDRAPATVSAGRRALEAGQSHARSSC
ncbi:hypothetical protein EVAR_16747_1 [Eumeta japonica]|uniref:Uncharacterized protein n=1 Tax=Eumeta variegata TaxID=151549 RepID=A0A4C1UL81_EUMVA|nr:hypothetical protein EVAR_16747_1 [Eumeta japonica]